MDFTKHNILIDTYLPIFQAYQDNFILTHPIYFQGLDTHTDPPKVDTTADKLSSKPSGQTTSWSDTGLISTKLPFSIRIDNYMTPHNAKGWQMILTTKDVDNTIYQRSIGFGMDTSGRTHDWLELHEDGT